MTDRPTTIKQAEVYVILKQMELKTRVTNVLLLVFVIAFVFLIFSFFYFEKPYVSIVTATLEAVLSPTVYLMCKHFFGATKVAKKIEEFT